MTRRDLPKERALGDAEESLGIEAFAELVREHQAGLRAFIRSLGVEAVWVDDIAQEAFVLAYRKQGEFDAGKDFGRWLRGLARHLAANERRKSGRRARLLDIYLCEVLAGGEEDEVPDDQPGMLEAMRACMEKLPERSRTLLRERYEGARSAAELGEMFGQSQEAIRQALYRIRQAVKECVDMRLIAR